MADARLILTEAAATIVAAACRGWQPHGPDDAASIWMTVEDYLAEQLEELARPSGDVVPVLTPAERAVLVARLRAQPLHVSQALHAAAQRFWAGVTAHERNRESLGIPVPPLRQQLLDAGFTLTDEART